jgi:hypothetical protein
MGVSTQKGGIFDKIEIHRFMDQQLVERLYHIYNDYPEDWKKRIQANLPTGLEPEQYASMMHMQVLLSAWHDISELMALSISIVNARIGYIVHLMLPQHRQRFCTMVNQLGKFSNSTSPSGEKKEETKVTLDEGESELQGPTANTNS